MSIALAAAIILVAQAAPTPADLADARYAGAMSLLDDKSKSDAKPHLQAAMMFFLGKIAGRSGHAAAGPALAAVSQELEAGGVEKLAVIAKQCAAEVGRVAVSS